ncbi:hypothetical protein E2C01_063372 [Portunus trituberculatus]|uniref:Uncharacterized protein n=1 Tax=Portunus trituberculatus TaxID=210409 RepID=A0A5B7HIS4_PORTR|nr:hypothetical protein [Portunus trituberculatus]
MLRHSTLLPSRPHLFNHHRSPPRTADNLATHNSPHKTSDVLNPSPLLPLNHHFPLFLLIPSHQHIHPHRHSIQVIVSQPPTPLTASPLTPPPPPTPTRTPHPPISME